MNNRRIFSRVLRTLGQLFWMIVLLAGTATVLAQSDNFDDGNDDGWLHYTPLAAAGVPGVYTFPNGNSYRIQTLTPSPDPGTVGPGRAGSLLTNGTHTNFTISVDIVNWDDTLPQAVGLLARVSDFGTGSEPGRADGYAFTWDRGTTATSGDVDISVVNNESPTTFEVGNDDIHFVPGRSYRLVFIGMGSNFEGLVYELPNTTTPVVRVTGFNEAHASGVGGLVVYDAGSGGNHLTDATFDNYVGLNYVRPTLAISRPSAEDVAVHWPMAFEGFILEGTASLSDPITWEDLSDRVFDLEGQWYYSEPSTIGNKFFRLRLGP